MQLGSAQTYKCPKTVVVCDVPVSSSTWFLFGRPDHCGISICCFHGLHELDGGADPPARLIFLEYFLSARCQPMIWGDRGDQDKGGPWSPGAHTLLGKPN